MKYKELKKKLIDENVGQYFYSFDEEYPNEAFCLIKQNEKWQVYYSEKGNKTGLKEFISEEEACDYFYDELIRFL